jgi:hypothetical protein
MSRIVYDNEGGEHDISELLPCPFCGSQPNFEFIGNYSTKKTKVRVKCSNRGCRIERTEASLGDWFGHIVPRVIKHRNTRSTHDQ